MVRTSQRNLSFSCLCMCAALLWGISEGKTYRLALSLKALDIGFYDSAIVGCQDQAEQLTRSLEGQDVSLECMVVGPETFSLDGGPQAQILHDWLDLYEFGESENLGDQAPLDAIAISVTFGDTMRPVIQRAKSLGVPVITFDSDMPDKGDSGRATYIGTDNFFFGEQLGKVLTQLQPEGGTYQMLTDIQPNIVERENGLRSELSRTGLWTELEPLANKGNTSYGVQVMHEACIMPKTLTAMVTVFGGPMNNEAQWLAMNKDCPDVTFVAGDASSLQIELLGRKKAAGLVAQMPYEMGVSSVNILWDLIQAQEANDASVAEDLPDFMGTNVIQLLQIPLVLPELIVDQNYLGNLRHVGRLLAGVVTGTAFSLVAWTWIYRNDRVVQVAQPGFLVMIALGSWILGLAMFPLSFDDASEDFTPTRGSVICMSIPWMTSIGFTVAFSALFAKTWRVNRLFRARQNFQRVEVTVMDVLGPFVLLLTANVVTLGVWSILSPLEYVRQDAPGLDAWNRVISTYGKCQAPENSTALPYLLILALLNGSVLLMANTQAYQTRHLQKKFSEAQSIGMVLGSLLQAFVIGVPVLIVVRDDPIANYWTLTLLIFIISMALLLMVFTPKVMQWQEATIEEANLRASIQQNSKGGSTRKGKERFHPTDFSNVWVTDDAQQPKDESDSEVGKSDQFQDEASAGVAPPMSQPQRKQRTAAEVRGSDADLLQRLQDRLVRRMRLREGPEYPENSGLAQTVRDIQSRDDGSSTTSKESHPSA